MKCVSENGDIFSLLELFVQVSIHKIKRKNGKTPTTLSESPLNLLSHLDLPSGDMSIVDGDFDDDNASSVTVLPQQIQPGSFAEKQLLAELELMYRRKKEKNDFELKISLVFSKEKIYEFDKQYV